MNSNYDSRCGDKQYDKGLENGDELAGNVRHTVHAGGTCVKGSEPQGRGQGSQGLVVSHDRKWTAEALFNILDNAVKYTPEYGSIRVCVESWEMHLKVSITDTGKGIPENQQGAIFRRFYREENVHDIEGIGIGLYLAREIISLQNGYIQVTSQVGTGSTFSVFLPHE